MDFVIKNYMKFIKKHGYIPMMFNPYNCQEIIDYSPTQTTYCGNTTSSATVLTIENNKGEIDMTTPIKGERYMNKLEKYNFDMEELKIFDAFMGIGALHTALKDLGVPCKVTSCSEIEIDAIMSYAIGHIDNFIELDFNFPSDEEMKSWLMERNIGYSFEKQKSSIPRLRKDKLRLVYKASILLNNLGDISRINPHTIPNFDIMNFSFSCTDLSNAGKQKGMKNEDGTPTRSGLYVFGMDILKVKKPKYIMIENVKGLIQKKFIDDFNSIIEELDTLGYNCYYAKKDNGQPTCLNAKNYGIPQNRERIFVICTRKDIDNKSFEFPKGFDNGIRLKHILEDSIEDKYYLSDDMKKYILDYNNVQQGTKWEGRADNDILNPNITHTISVRGAGGGQRAGVSNFIINNYDNEIRVKNIKVDNKDNIQELKIRKLTPKECWRLMGFSDEHFDKAKAIGISDSSLYKQAGNSIVVNVLYYIFKNLFKDYMI